jgi:HlyB family type I secretion system ABC transporter
LALSLLGLATPRLTQAVLDRAVPARDLALLARLVFLLFLVAAGQVALTIYRRLAFVRLTIDLDRALLRGLCAHLLALPASFFREFRSGDLAARLADQAYVRHLFTGSLTRVLIDSAMVLVYFAVMFHYSALLTLLVIGCLLAFAGYSLWVGPMMKRSHQRLLEDKAAQEALLLEILAGVDMVKAMALERRLRGRWEVAYAAHMESHYRTLRLRQLLESAATAVKFVSTVGVLWLGAVLVVRQHLSAGELVAFALYAGQATVPLLSLITLSEEVQQARAALARVEEILTHPPEPRPLAKAPRYPWRLEGGITFDRVSFTYPGSSGRPVLRGVSFDIRPGERVAIVGQSGSGKTTLTRLVLGLYRPTAGRILIDGTDLGELDLEAYRRQVGVVLQENFLLPGTVRDNIAPDDPSPDAARVAEAARRAGAYEFIGSLPEGYDTAVGERGLTLSGGQRQRIGLARALYRDPRLLILDEATSAVDRPGESAIHRNLAAVLEDRTALVIAHNLATVCHADRILVLHEGVIVEQGTHGELLNGRGHYYTLAGCPASGRWA